MNKFISLILSAYFIIGCKSDSLETVQTQNYSVLVSYQNSKEKIFAFDILKSTIEDTLISYNEVAIKIGLFNSLQKASDRGFELFADDVISNFKIVYKDSVFQNNYTSFYFVGWYLDRPALYKTDLLNIDPQLVWSKWGRKIMNLDRSVNRDKYFFSTSLHDGIRGSFPLIMDTRLYYFDRADENINLILKAGNVMNIKGEWVTDTTFTTYISVLDSLLTSNIIQYQFDFSGNGEIIDSTERIFELIEGIPVPQFSKINPISPNLRYKLTTTSNDSLLTLNILDELNGTTNFVTTITGEIKENRWNASGDYLFLSTEMNEYFTGLYVINLPQMKVTDYLGGIGEKNFIVIGNLLIFDSGFGSDSFITLYRYRRSDIFSEIKILGGCGINNIPKRDRIF